MLSQNSLPRYKKYYSDEITRAFLEKIAPTMRRLPSGRLYSQAAVLIAQTLKEIALTPGSDEMDHLVTLNGDLESLYEQ